MWRRRIEGAVGNLGFGVEIGESVGLSNSKSIWRGFFLRELKGESNREYKIATLLEIVLRLTSWFGFRLSGV